MHNSLSNCWLNALLQCLEANREAVALPTTSAEVLKMNGTYSSREAERVAEQNLFISFAIETMTDRKYEDSKPWDPTHMLRQPLDNIGMAPRLGDHHDPAELLSKIGPIGRVLRTEFTTCRCGYQL